MRLLLAVTVLLLAFPSLAHAQQWSVGVSSGPFGFGDFLERTVRPANEDEIADPSITVLSAATRPGLSVDVERSFGRRWAVRADAAFTRAPLSVGEKGADGVSVDAGDLDVTTVMLPLVFRINPSGAFRFHLHGGPAMAIYKSHARANAVGVVPLFRGTRSRTGYAYGGGVAWWLRERVAIEANLTDITTSSPFNEEELPNTPGVHVPRTHNVHGTAGVRWRF